MTKSKYVRIFPMTRRWEKRMSLLIVSVGLAYIIVFCTILALGV